MDHLVTAAEQFALSGRVLDLREYGQGNVNDTFLVTLEAPGEAHFILQRLNTAVFHRPELVMANLSLVTAHLRRHLASTPLRPGRRWEVPRVLLTQNRRDHWLDPDGSFWRALSFIDAAQSFDVIQDVPHAREVGYGLGMFHHLLNDLPAEQLADTLPGFHITPGYLQHYDVTLAHQGAPSSPEVNYGLHFVEARRAWGHVLENAKAQGILDLRPIHGDPKVNNVMMDQTTGQAVSMIDMDTVKPGLVHYDIGDCLRSGCNPLGEAPENWEAVRFEPDIGRAILQGYFFMAGDFLTESDYTYLFAAIRLIAFELGLRFFTDYLAGNVYFKTRYPEQNLLRALVQFRLTESIEAQAATLQTIIRDERNAVV